MALLGADLGGMAGNTLYTSMPRQLISDVDLTDAELKYHSKNGRKLIKEAKKLGLDTTPIENDVKALQISKRLNIYVLILLQLLQLLHVSKLD